MQAGFQEAKRKQESFLAPLEKPCLIWLARHAPSWINSDHLTALGLIALLGAGLGYWWARSNPAGLYVVIVCLALNWLGDSLDGTLARVRNRLRPRYGFYIDHVVDAFGALFLLVGVALSGYMSERIALGLLIAYLMLSIEVYLASEGGRRAPMPSIELWSDPVDSQNRAPSELATDLPGPPPLFAAAAEYARRLCGR